MMGNDSVLKNKALNGIRAVIDNMKLGDYALGEETDKAVQLLYEARQAGGGVDALLRTTAMFGENAADRYDPISQAIALALEGKAESFRELMLAYNRNAAHYADATQMEMFGEKSTKEEFVNEFLKFRNWKDYETRHSNEEGNGNAGGSAGGEQGAQGGSRGNGEEVDGRQQNGASETNNVKISPVGESDFGPVYDPREVSDDCGSIETSGSINPADPMKGMEKAAEAYREEQRLKLQKKDSEEDEMFVSLQNKKGKEYYDTVTELARRIATNETQSRRGALELSEQPRIRGERSGRDAEDGHESVSLLRGAIHIIAQERRRALGENGERNWRKPRNKQGDENLITHKNINITSADTKLRKEIERRVYEWAQANDMLFSEDEVRENSYGGKLLGKGSEAHAYLTKDRSKVIKFVKPDFFTIRKDLGGYAEYIDDSNNVFPDTAYKIIGMSKDGRGKILVVTEQPFVDGKQLSLNGWEKNNCNDKVRKYFADKGFEDLYGDAIYFGNNDYCVSDIGYGNVVFKNGEPVVIEANVLPMSVTREQQREKEQQRAKQIGIKISYFEKEIQNERNVIEYFKKARNDENKDSIDGFIARHEQKIKNFQK